MMISQRKQKLLSFLICLLLSFILTVSGFSIVSPSQNRDKKIRLNSLADLESSTDAIPLYYRSRTGRHRRRESLQERESLFEIQNFLETFEQPSILSFDKTNFCQLHQESLDLLASYQSSEEKKEHDNEWTESFGRLCRDHYKHKELSVQSQKWRDAQRQLLFLSLQHQRQEMRSSSDSCSIDKILALLSQNQIFRLQQLPNEIIGIKNDSCWNDWYCRMVDKYTSHGHLFQSFNKKNCVAVVDSEDDRALFQWVQLQRSLFSLGLLHAQQVQLLWAVNFCWDTSEAEFMTEYQRLRQIEEEERVEEDDECNEKTDDLLNILVTTTTRRRSSKYFSVRHWKKLQELS